MFVFMFEQQFETIGHAVRENVAYFPLSAHLFSFLIFCLYIRINGTCRLNSFSCTFIIGLYVTLQTILLTQRLLTHYFCRLLRRTCVALLTSQ